MRTKVIENLIEKYRHRANRPQDPDKLKEIIDLFAHHLERCDEEIAALKKLAPFFTPHEKQTKKKP